MSARQTRRATNTCCKREKRIQVHEKYSTRRYVPQKDCTTTTGADRVVSAVLRGMNMYKMSAHREKEGEACGIDGDKNIREFMYKGIQDA